jgi:uncharacterized protein DUF6899
LVQEEQIMPYIKKEDRVHVDLAYPTNAGELNYAITCLCRDYFHTHGGRYQQVNDVVGALEGAKLEFYRRVAAPYEDQKILENGDVYR